MNLDTVNLDATCEQPWRTNLGKSKLDLSFPRKNDWFTGLNPEQTPGFGPGGKLYSLIIPNLSTCSRAEVLEYFNNTWTLTELLFSSLIGDEAFYRPPYHSLRHPLIFYYVHPAALYVNKFKLAGLLNAPVSAEFEHLFDIGVDEMSWDDMSKNDIVWPTIEAAQEYRRRVYSLVVDLIASNPGLDAGHDTIDSTNPLWSLFMGFEHERIHLETSSVLIRELPAYLVGRPEAFPASADGFNKDAGSDQLNFLSVSAGRVAIGKSRAVPTFGWDNEYGQREVDVASFEATQSLVSNLQYWQFVQDGGYQKQELWTETGWKWRQFRHITHPTFWTESTDQEPFRLRTVFSVIDMQWDWPVVCNYHEGKAYCAWLAAYDEHHEYNLLTEAEHKRMVESNALILNSLAGEVTPPQGNTNLRSGSESSVHCCGNNINSGSNYFCDLYGNVWQWLEDAFNPLPGFEANPLYADFSTPCFDGEHQMICGGSFISTGDEASIHARFHFRPHFFQHAGLRIVRKPAV